MKSNLCFALWDLQVSACLPSSHQYAWTRIDTSQMPEASVSRTSTPSDLRRCSAISNRVLPRSKSVASSCTLKVGFFFTTDFLWWTEMLNGGVAPVESRVADVSGTKCQCPAWCGTA